MGVKVNQSPDDRGALSGADCLRNAAHSAVSQMGSPAGDTCQQEAESGGEGTTRLGFQGLAGLRPQLGLEDGVLPESLVAEASLLVANLTTSKT